MTIGSSTTQGNAYATEMEHGGLYVNDVQSRLNATRVQEIIKPASLEEICRLVKRANKEKAKIAVAGGRHAMGGQQFAAGELLLDTRDLNHVIHLDSENGIIEAQAGIQWPELLDYLWKHSGPKKEDLGWSIRQKQTGADRLSLGGALAANAHGRGLRMKPFISDVESFVLVNHRAEPLFCDRQTNRELFSLVGGGYGMFGIVYSIRLRLQPRQKMRRSVDLLQLKDVMQAFQKRIEDGCLYGDYQFCTDETSPDFMKLGVFSYYEPTEKEARLPKHQAQLSPEDWHNLYHLSHTDKARGFRAYSSFYLSTAGQVYWSDTSQLSYYQDNYHQELDAKLQCKHPGSEIISELYVPRDKLEDFMEAARKDFLENNVNLIYGTIRLIEKDEESYLAWAREPYACVIFNIHTDHTLTHVAHSAATFRRLIQLARERGGSYFLTYHRFAVREQILGCYPEFRDFLQLKKEYDPDETFQSDWYRHYKSILEIDENAPTSTGSLT